MTIFTSELRERVSSEAELTAKLSSQRS